MRTTSLCEIINKELVGKKVRLSNEYIDVEGIVYRIKYVHEDNYLTFYMVFDRNKRTTIRKGITNMDNCYKFWINSDIEILDENTIESPDDVILDMSKVADYLSVKTKERVDNFEKRFENLEERFNEFEKIVIDTFEYVGDEIDRLYNNVEDIGDDVWNDFVAKADEHQEAEGSKQEQEICDIRDVLLKTQGEVFDLKRDYKYMLENYKDLKDVFIKSIDGETVVKKRKKRIPLSKYTLGNQTCLVGENTGDVLLMLMKIEEQYGDLTTLEQKFDELIIHIPDKILTISDTFFRAFLGDRVVELGKLGFNQKYKFATSSHIQDKIQCCIDRILLEERR